MEKVFNKIINEICLEEGIEKKEISYGWILELKKDNKIHHIIGNKLDLNTEISFEIVNDKFATFEVLKNNNIPIIDHKMIFNPNTRSNYYKNSFIEEAKKLFKNYKKVVVKANHSYQGKDVHICENELEVSNIIDRLFKQQNDTLSVCPYINIVYEYRCIYLDGEIIFVYKKEKPYVIGDGISSLNRLIERKELNENIKIELLKDLDLNIIKKKKKKIIISWKHNLSNGAIPLLVNADDEFIEKVKNIARQAGNVLNTRFVSIDISLTDDKNIYVMEVNGNVCLTKFVDLVPKGYKIAKEVYYKAINKMFI